MLVYVLNVNGLPLMPTDRCGKVKHLLKEGKAKVVKRCPFTIQLTFECGNYTQSVTLGVDAGSKHTGISATTKEKELYVSEVELRTDIVDLLSSRREQRRTRRNRKTRYRKMRFDNRVHSKNKGWLAPSIENKINTHLTIVDKVCKLLPISTGEVLDNAQGYGYRSKQKAYAAYTYKNRDRSKDKEVAEKKKHIQQWMREHKSFVRLMDDYAFEIAKGSWGLEDKFDAKLVRKMLKENNLEVDFTAGELLKVWRKYK